MTEKILAITENTPLTRDVFRMTLAGDVSDITRPGQFINVKLDGLYLRRPISVSDKKGDTVTILYKVVGKGTEMMSRMAAGERLNVLSGLGNGFDTSPSGDAPVLIGGGIGIAPLYLLAETLAAEGKKVSAVLGYRTKDDIFCADELEALGVSVTVATEDGTAGIKGFVTDALAGIDYTYYYACGPEAMLKAVHRTCPVSGQLSFEARMGCGFGACMGCSCRTITGYKRICKEGPVMTKEEIIW